MNRWIHHLWYGINFLLLYETYIFRVINWYILYKCYFPNHSRFSQNLRVAFDIVFYIPAHKRAQHIESLMNYHRILSQAIYLKPDPDLAVGSLHLHFLAILCN